MNIVLIQKISDHIKQNLKTLIFSGYSRLLKALTDTFLHIHTHKHKNTHTHIQSYELKR